MIKILVFNIQELPLEVDLIQNLNLHGIMTQKPRIIQDQQKLQQWLEDFSL